MGKYHSPVVEYKCPWDHGYEDCPGHTLKVTYHNTSDTIEVLVDDEHYVTFSDTMFAALLDADEKAHKAMLEFSAKSHGVKDGL
jgi:TRAP-type mannitol/chloroaromatic compound transport system substrate-binding protein